MASIDPTTLATQLAVAYTQPSRSLLDAQASTQNAIASALSKLRTALTGFTGTLAGVSGSTGQGVTPYSATLSDSSLATATARNGATAMSTPLFIESVATHHQVAFEDLPAVPAGPGSMSVQLDDGSSFGVALAGADTDGDGTLSQAEIARAINQAAGGKATAMVVTVGGQSQLLLTSGVSGAGGRLTLDTSGLPAGALRTALEDPAKRKELVAAQDAVVWLGEQGTGVRLQQSGNVVTAIDGVTLTLTKAQAAGSAATMLSVARDDGATGAKLKSVVDAFNTLKKTLDELTAVGKDGAPSAAFATDSGVRALRSRLNTLLRQSFDGVDLRTVGVGIDRNGTLSLDSAKLVAALGADPAALDKVLGKASLSAPSGLLGALTGAVDLWTHASSGQIARRQNTVQTLQASISARQTRLDQQYQQSYQRYLMQFTLLQDVQTRLSDTSGLLSSLYA